MLVTQQEEKGLASAIENRSAVVSTHTDLLQLLNLGRMYCEGEDREINYDKAIFFLNAAVCNFIDPRAEIGFYWLGKAYLGKASQEKMAPSEKTNKNLACAAYCFSRLTTRLKIENGATLALLENRSLYRDAELQLAKILLLPFSLSLSEKEKEKYFYIETSHDLNGDYNSYTSGNKKRRSLVKHLLNIQQDNDSEVFFLLAQHYEQGEFFEPDFLKAAQNYAKADEKGHKVAAENFRRLVAQHKQEKAKQDNKEEKETKQNPQQLSGQKHPRGEEKKDDNIKRSPRKRRKLVEDSDDESAKHLEEDPDLPQQDLARESSGAGSSSDNAPLSSASVVKSGKEAKSDEKQAALIGEGAPLGTIKSTNKVEGKSEDVPVIKGREFSPSVQPSAIDFSSVGFFKTNFSRQEMKLESKKAAPEDDRVPVKQKTKLTEKAKYEIGRWGEHCVYLKLRDHLTKKYAPAVVTEDEKGFQLINEEKNIEITLQWYNKQKESYGNKDLELTIIKQGEVTKKRIIEVKTTTSNRQNIAHFPASEFALMMAHRENYCVYRVSGAGTMAVNIAKIVDPLQQILDSRIAVSKLALTI